jgi:hypothetical protein
MIKLFSAKTSTGKAPAKAGDGAATSTAGGRKRKSPGELRVQKGGVAPRFFFFFFFLFENFHLNFFFLVSEPNGTHPTTATTTTKSDPNP